MNNSTLSELLSKLGFTAEESAVYECLVKTGSITVLELARKTKINRTRVYRIFEDLKKRGVVEEEIDEYRKKVRAASVDHLEYLVQQAENTARSVRELFPEASKLLLNRNVLEQPGTMVLFYRGKDGVKQQVWNTLRAEKEVVGYTYRSLSELVGKKFMQEWKDEFVLRKLHFRDVCSDEYERSMKGMERDVYPTSSFKGRYISSKTLDINHQEDIYNNVISYYNWFEGEVFGVEIYNEKIAAFEKQIFELVWKTPLSSSRRRGSSSQGDSVTK